MMILAQDSAPSPRLRAVGVRFFGAAALIVSFGPIAPVSARGFQAASDERSEQGPVRSTNETPAVEQSESVRTPGAPSIPRSQGVSSVDLVRRALTSNPEITAVRLDVERARGRLRQAGLRPNPTVDFEQTTGRWTDPPGEIATTVGFALPFELGGKRQRRLDLTLADLEATEAEVADRERRLTADVRAAYADAMAAARELQITSDLNTIDVQTASLLEARVSVGDAAPLELNLVRVEVDRLRARRTLIGGRLQAALLRLKNLSGIPPSEPLQLGEDLASVVLSEPPATLESAIAVALRTRPDLRVARLTQEVANAGLRLARALAVPDLTAFSRYSINRSVFDQTPVGVLQDRDKLLSFGISISIPVFNRNQGAVAEARTSITQAERRLQLIEAIVRADVSSAYARYRAATQAVQTFKEGVIDRSAENIQAIRGAYQIGAYRITELLTEQRRLADSQREYTEALAERYRALSDLQTAIGAPANP